LFINIFIHSEFRNSTWKDDIEITKIKCYKESGLTNRKIAKELNRSHGVIDNYVRFGNNYSNKNRSGRKSLISNWDRRRIMCTASKNHYSSAKLVHDLNISITSRSVRQILNDSKQFKWTKRQCKPSLKKHHLSSRLHFARKYMSWTSEWHNVIFSDEKKFNLDGHYGCQFYWHDLRKEPEKHLSRNFGGGSVMVWGVFSFYHKSSICWISNKMKSKDYINVLNDALLPIIEDESVIQDRE